MSVSINKLVSDKTAYIKSLDGLRGVAIILVVLWHYIACLIKPGAGVLHIIKSLLASTWSGVDLFFVLSGFLLGRILLVNIQSSQFYSTFYIRRILRIFPLYYLFLILYLIIKAYFIRFTVEDEIPVITYFFHIQNFFMSKSFGDTNLGVTWSLSIEEQFYLILPLLIRISRKNIIYIVIAGIIIAPFVRFIIGGNAAYVLLPARIDTLLFGVMIAWLFVYDKLNWFADKTMELLIAILGVLILIVLLSLFTEWNKTGGVFNHTVYAILYSLLLILTVQGKWKLLKKVFEMPVLVYIGKVSYGLYLIHLPINALLFYLIRNSTPRLNSFADFSTIILSFSACLLILFYSNRYFETPIRNLGKKFRY